VPTKDKVIDSAVADADVREYLQERALNSKRIDRRFVNRRAAVAAGRDQVFLEDLESLLSEVVPAGYYRAGTYKGKKRKCEREVQVFLSDLHYQSLLDPREVPKRYGATEEARRTGKVVASVADYKRDHRAETKLRVHLIGDLIQNQLHDPRDGAPLTVQFGAALHYLASAILFWGREFPAVTVECTPGNHGRFMSRHPERAIHQKWDAIETAIYLALRHIVAAAGAKNVTVNIGQRPYYTFTPFGETGFCTHGDTVLNPGRPNKDIKIAALYQQICRFNAARGIGGPFKFFAVGHVHFGSITKMPGGVTMLTNGCLVPPDPFAVGIGAPDVSCGQWMFESTPGNFVGDQRFIDVDDADDEPGYESVIKPFQGIS